MAVMYIFVNVNWVSRMKMKHWTHHYWRYRGIRVQLHGIFVITQAN